MGRPQSMKDKIRFHRAVLKNEWKSDFIKFHLSTYIGATHLYVKIMITYVMDRISKKHGANGFII